MGGGGSRHRPGQTVRKGGVLTLEVQIMIVRKRRALGCGLHFWFMLLERAFCSLSLEMLGSLTVEMLNVRHGEAHRRK